jgi:hypothetical protein
VPAGRLAPSAQVRDGREAAQLRRPPHSGEATGSTPKAIGASTLPPSQQPPCQRVRVWGVVGWQRAARPRRVRSPWSRQSPRRWLSSEASWPRGAPQRRRNVLVDRELLRDRCCFQAVQPGGWIMKTMQSWRWSGGSSPTRICQHRPPRRSRGRAALSSAWLSWPARAMQRGASDRRRDGPGSQG